jgi:hypothetical protein
MATLALRASTVHAEHAAVETTGRRPSLHRMAAAGLQVYGGLRRSRWRGKAVHSGNLCG